MTQLRLGALALCVIAFGLMTLGATAAQAEQGSQWLIANALGLIPLTEPEADLEAETEIVLHAKISGISILWGCAKISAVKTRLLANGSIGEKEGSVKGSKTKSSSCVTKLNGTTSAACEPNAGGKEKGVINSNAEHALLVLHLLESGVRDDLVQDLPDTGETIASIEMSEECAIGEKVPVIGRLFLKDCSNDILTHLLKHLMEVGPLTELWVISKTAEHVTTMLGSWWMFLVGPFTGLRFSGDPH